MALLFFVAEVFSVLDFPFNLPAPFFSAVSSMFLISFIFDLLNYANFSSYPTVQLIERVIYPIVFITIMAFGYVRIFMD